MKQLSLFFLLLALCGAPAAPLLSKQSPYQDLYGSEDVPSKKKTAKTKKKHKKNKAIAGTTLVLGAGAVAVTAGLLWLWSGTGAQGNDQAANEKDLKPKETPVELEKKLVELEKNSQRLENTLQETQAKIDAQYGLGAWVKWAGLPVAVCVVGLIKLFWGGSSVKS